MTMTQQSIEEKAKEITSKYYSKPTAKEISMVKIAICAGISMATEQIRTSTIRHNRW